MQQLSAQSLQRQPAVPDLSGRRARLASPRPSAPAPSGLAWLPSPQQQCRIGGGACSEATGRQGARQITCGAVSGGYSSSGFGSSGSAGASDAGGSSIARLSEPARAALTRATGALRRYGWLSFWTQLTLSTVSGAVLLFSVAFTSQTGPKAALWLTILGILGGFLSTYWAYGYQRTAQRMQEYLDGAEVAKIKKQAVLESVASGIAINVAALGSIVLAILSLTSVLVSKTLANVTIDAAAAAAAGYNPVIALDVFLVQAAVNQLLSHFLALVANLWILNVIGEGRGLKFQRKEHILKLREKEAGTDELLRAAGVDGGRRR